MIASIENVAHDMWYALPWFALAGLSAIVMAVIAATVLGVSWSILSELFRRGEQSVVADGNKIVPTVFALFATLGAATASSSGLPTAASFGLTILVAVMMFISSVLKQVAGERPAKVASRAIGSVGVIASPAIAVGYILSETNLDNMSADDWIVLVGSGVILIASVVAAFVLRRKDFVPT
jgi:hypothetical protein